MKNYDYLIVGGGMTAAAATKGIRDVDASGTVGMFSKETDPPYNRPPLSKALWKGKPVDSVWRKLSDVDVHLGRTITRVHPIEKRVDCDDGSSFSYGKLLLATGGQPRLLPLKEDSIIYYRTLSDYRRLRELTEKGQKFAVIGGGFIGTEIAAALSMNDKEVAMIFRGKSIGDRIFPADLSHYVNDYYQQNTHSAPSSSCFSPNSGAVSLLGTSLGFAWWGWGGVDALVKSQCFQVVQSLRFDAIARQMPCGPILQDDRTREMTHEQVACRAFGWPFVQVVELSVTHLFTFPELSLHEVPDHQTH